LNKLEKPKNSVTKKIVSKTFLYGLICMSEMGRNVGRMVMIMGMRNEKQILFLSKKIEICGK